MDDARRAAFALICALLFADAAGAQDSASPPSAPIPYVQLKRAERTRAQQARATAAQRARAAKLHAAAVVKRAPTPGAAVTTGAAPASRPIPPVVVATPTPAPAPALRPPPVARAPVPSASVASVPPPTTRAASRPALPLPPPAPQLSARLAPGGAPLEAEVEAFVDGEVARSFAGDRGAGVVVAVVQGGRTVLLKGYGWADVAGRRPADPRSTLMRLGSASWLLTSLFVLKEVEAGRLRLEAPADATLPAALRLPLEGFKRPVRLDELMRQRSGLEARDLGRLFTTADRVLPLDEALRRDRPHRVRDPGALPMESDYGAALAGAAAAHAAGGEFEAAIERELLAPAGLVSTSFREPRPARDGLPKPLDAQRTSRLAQGYAWTHRGTEARAWGFAGGLAPALGAVTTAEDMARLMSVELAGGTAPGGPQVWGVSAAAALRATDARDGARDGRTLGEGAVTLPGGFAGFGDAGGAPGFRARYLVAPQLALGVFVAGNSEAAAGLVDGLAPDLVQRFYSGSSPTEGTTATPGVAGLYLPTRRAYHGLEGFADRLRGPVRVAQGEDGALVVRGAGYDERLAPAAGDQFHAADGSEWRTAGALNSASTLLIHPSSAASFERVATLYRPETLETVTALALVTALLVLLGPIGRAGRDSNRPTPAQTAAAATQGVAALLWIAAIGCVLIFLRRTADSAALMRGWPDTWLVAGSGCGLAAAVLSVTQVVQLPSAWAEGRRLAGWSLARKLRHTASVFVFAALASVSAAWGALEPWSG